jgi:hypothetical protein
MAVFMFRLLEDRAEIQSFLLGPKLHGLVSDLDQMARSELKYNTTITADASAVWQRVRDEIRESGLLQDY